MTQIVIVDYGMGNLASVRNAIRAVGFDAVISADPVVVGKSGALVLPGVGAFGNGMAKLRARGLLEPVRALAAAGRPVMGICLGMQLLFEYGEEAGGGEGLGLLKGRVVRLPAGLKLPQMGWNLVEPVRPAHPIFAGLPDAYYAYFDHAYAADCVDAADVAATTEYGRVYPSVVARGNILGIQFHPEKSSRAGLQMLANFGRML